MLSEDRRKQLDGIVQQMTANNETDADIQFVVNDFKTKYGVSEAPKPESSGFFSDVATAASNRLSNIRNPKDSRLRKIPIIGPSIIGPASNVAGQAMGFLAGDVPMAALKAFTPEPVKKELGQLIATQKGNPIVDTAAGIWNANPEDIRNDYENLLNISMVGPQGSFLRGAARGTATVGKEGFNIARDLGTLVATKTPEVIEKKLGNLVTKGIEKGIRPTVVGKRTAKKMDAYYGRAKDAVKTIVDNKDNLILTDAEGNALSGELPKTLKQFSEAIDQTKRSLYDQYHAMATEAGETGAAFNAEGIISKLDDVAKDLKHNPQVRKYAEDLKAEIWELHGQSPEIVEARIADLNNSLSGYYEGRVGKAKAQVDGSVAKQMREELDGIIMNASGPGYQQLKNQYGALKALEKEVNHRAVVFSRQSPNGFFEMSDIFTTGEILGGVLTMNPAMIAKGLAGKAAKKMMKQANNADRIIQKMFSESEKIIGKETMPEMRSAAGQRILGQLSGLDDILAKEVPGAVPIPRRPILNPNSTAVGPARSGVLQGEPYGPPASPWQPKPAALPPGQGFELRGTPTGPDVIDVPFTSRTRTIPGLPAPQAELGQLMLPAGQGFELVPGVRVIPDLKIKGTAPRPPVIDAGGGENLVTRIEQMGGIKFSKDYNTKWLKEDVDAKRVLNNTQGQSLDSIAHQLQSEGWPVESGDDIIELLKSGQGRKIYNPEKAERLFNRDIRRAENEWIEKQLEKEQINAGAIRESIPDHQARIIDEIRSQGIVEEGNLDKALNEISDFFAEMSGQKKPVKKAGPAVLGEIRVPK